MNWLQPWAWLGVAAVILPIAIHLFGHGPARVLPFPSLRFIDPSRLLPSRRTRIQDPLLLATRCSILIAAAAAMAQPLFGHETHGVTAGAVTRVILIDTSASLQRALPGGRTALDEARRLAKSVADSTPVHLLVETNRVGAAIGPASEWLSQQPERGTVVVITDAQLGSIDSTDVASLASDLGLEFITVRPASAGEAMQWRLSNGTGTTLVTAAGAETRDFTWQWTASAPLPSSVILWAASDQPAEVAAAMNAAHALGARLPLDTAIAVTVLYPGAANRDAIIGTARPFGDAAVARLAERIADDSLLLASAWRDSSQVPDTSRLAGFIPIATRRTGTVAVWAAESRNNGHPALLLVVRGAPESVLSVAALAAVERATSQAPRAEEASQATVSAESIARWQRPPRPRTALQPGVVTDRPTDARWFWALAIGLILLEYSLRRRTPQARLT